MSSCWQCLHRDCLSSGASCVQEWALLQEFSLLSIHLLPSARDSRAGGCSWVRKPTRLWPPAECPSCSHSVSLVAGVCHLCLVCVTRGWCVQHPARHCYCSCWQSLPLTHFRSHIPAHEAVQVRCCGAPATPAPACCWTAALPLPREALDRGSETLEAGVCWGHHACLMPVHQPAQGLLQSAPSEPEPLCRAGREPWPVPAGSRSIGRAGCRQGPQQFPHYLAGGGA